MNGTLNFGLDLWNVSNQLYRLVAELYPYARPRSGDARRLIDELLLVHDRERLAMLLGVKSFALDWKKHTTPVYRAALMLHLLTFSGGDKVTVFDILTGCRYKLPSSCGVRRAPDQPANVTFKPVSSVSG